MRSLSGALALAVLSFSQCASQETQVRFLTTHDLHGALKSQVYGWSDGRPIGGVGVLKTIMDRAEAECRCVTFRLDGGDQMQGTLESNLTYGASVVEAFNLMKLDAAAVGNHDLDWGVDTLRARQTAANYAWLAANVRVQATGERPNWAQPYAIIERDGIKLGVIGYATESTGRMLMTSLSAPYQFLAGVSGIRDALEAVRAERPDFVVIVAHAIGDCVARCGGEMVRLARELERGDVDLIVGGHRHTPGFGMVNGIPILRAGASGSGVGVVDLYRDASGNTRFTMRVDTAFADVIPPDPAMMAAMAPYFALADSLAERPVITAAKPMLRRGREYGLGRLIADAIRSAAGADVALTNRGGIRSDVPGGTVTYGDLYRVKPFGNTVHRFQLSGRVLRAVVEHALRGRTPEFFSGIRIRYDPTRPSGDRVVAMELSDGSTVADRGIYVFATSNFLGGGGGGFSMLETLEPQRLGITVLEALIVHAQTLPSPVEEPTDERVVAINRD